MANSMEHIENLLKKADFSKETDLKQRLDRQLFSVRKVTLDELMQEEGIGQHTADRSAPSRSHSAKRQMEKETTKDSLGALERDNPMIKKGKPPVM